MQNLLFLGYGPISSYLIDALLLKNPDLRVIVYSKKTILPGSSNVKYISNWDEITLDKVDLVINSWKTLQEDIDRSRIEILGKISQHNNKKVVLINFSSVSIYGNNRALLVETSKVQPINTYGEDKARIEDQLRLYGYPLCLNLRISNVYGHSKSNDVLNKIFCSIQNSTHMFLDSPDRILRDFIFIEDVVSVIVKLLDLDKDAFASNFENINVATGQSISISHAISILEMLLGRKLSYSERNPDSLTILQSSVSVEKLNSLIQNQFINTEEGIIRYFASKLSTG
jgi:nucleoside-diphosphate-sugar epimerase